MACTLVTSEFPERTSAQHVVSLSSTRPPPAGEGAKRESSKRYGCVSGSPRKEHSTDSSAGASGYGYGGCRFGGGNVHSGGDAYQYAHAACVAFAVLYISKHVLGNQLMFFVESLEAATAGNSNIWSVTTKDRVSPQLYLRELS